MSFYGSFDWDKFLNAGEVVGRTESVQRDDDGVVTADIRLSDGWERNRIALYIEDLWSPWRYNDNPFHNYTPFPKLDAAERKARAAATEGRERLSAAWKVLRSGDRDPFNEGCDCDW